MSLRLKSSPLFGPRCVGSNLSGDGQAILIFSSFIDLLIFGYLAFYPRVKQAFEKTY
jgi:hypothetical protein